jgi:undecaprenyl-diphosphatase
MRAHTSPPNESVRSARWPTLPVLVWLAAAMLLVLFAHLGGEIGEGETAGFDGYVLHAAQSLRTAHPGISVVMRDLTAVGGSIVLALITAGSCGYLLLTRAWRTAVLLALSVLSAAGSVELLKAVFARARPEPAFAEYAATGLSFPSGHTSMSAVVFLTLGLLVARTRRRASERTYIVVASVLLVSLAGMSRAALGVHWATDVIGGWAFGAGWATAWLLVARHFDGRPRKDVDRFVKKRFPAPVRIGDRAVAWRQVNLDH